VVAVAVASTLVPAEPEAVVSVLVPLSAAPDDGPLPFSDTG